MFAFLSSADRRRFERTHCKLLRHEVSAWVLTGGLALEIQLMRRGGPELLRPLNDIDFIVEAFDNIPRSLGDDFLIRHVHPHDPPAKTLLQAIDVETALRTDVFRAYGDVLARSEGGEGGFRVVALADMVARLGRLTWDIVEGRELPTKYARDFQRALDFVTESEVETAWCDHRKPFMAETFADAVEVLNRAVEHRPELLVTPHWYGHTPEVCIRCEAVAGLPLADPERIIDVMGYC